MRKQVHPKLLLTAVALLTLPTLTLAWDDQDGKTRNAYEQQQHTYQKHGYDTYRNGPLPEAHQPTNTDRYNEYQRQQAEEDRRRQERMNQQNQGYSYGSGQHRQGH